MENKESLRKKVVTAGIGESLVVNAGDYSYATVRGYASEIGFALRRKYSVRINRENRTFTITRTA